MATYKCLEIFWDNNPWASQPIRLWMNKLVCETSLKLVILCCILSAPACSSPPTPAWLIMILPYSPGHRKAVVWSITVISPVGSWERVSSASTPGAWESLSSPQTWLTKGPSPVPAALLHRMQELQSGLETLAHRLAKLLHQPLHLVLILSRPPFPEPGPYF